MTLADPDVKYATANYGGGITEVLVLFNNPGGYGFVRLEALQGAAIKGSFERCYDPRVTPLNHLASISLSGIVQPIDYIKAYRCNADSDQNCGASPPTCTNKILTSYFNTGGLYPVAYNNSSPGVPPGLTITPGDRSLNVSWNSVPDPSGPPEVFAYYFAVYNGGTKIIGGWLMAGVRSIRVTDLTNGVKYDIYVTAVSHSNVSSSQASGTGTPVALCATPACNFVVG